MRLALVGMLVIAFAFTSSAHAADVAAGKAKAEICAGCHGENGISQTENIPSLAGQPDQFIQWQLVYFRAGSRKNEQMQPIVEQLQRRHPQSRRLFRLADAAQGARMTIRICRKRAGGGRPALRLMPHRQLRRHQGGRPRRRPARRISSKSAARLQIRRALRRRSSRDGGCRLSPERRGDHGARALSCASLAPCMTSAATKRWRHSWRQAKWQKLLPGRHFR